MARLPTAARPFDGAENVSFFFFFCGRRRSVVDEKEEVALEPVSAREKKRPIRSAVGAKLDAASSLAKI